MQTSQSSPSVARDGPSKILRGGIATKQRSDLSKLSILANLVVCNLTKWPNLISSVTYSRKYYNDCENNENLRTVNKKEKVSKLNKKENIYRKGSYKDDHHYVQTSTKFFYNSKQKNPKYECTLKIGCIIRCPSDFTVDLRLYLGWLVLTHVLHLNILINHEYSRMLPVSLCLNFYLALRLGGIKQNKGIFLLFLKLLRLVLFLQNSGSKILFFSCEIIIYSSF